MNSLNYESNATENDGSCILIVEGCTDNTACNYNSNANVNDNSCDYTSCVGCMDTTACNFEPSATQSGECTYAQLGYYCDGSCTADFDGDGICDMFEIVGCTEEGACNYNEEATDPDDSCTYAQPEYNCEGTCISDLDGDSICDAFETAPDLISPNDTTVSCSSTDYGSASTSGGCSTPSLTYNDFVINGSCPQSFIIMRTYISSDLCGNLSSATQMITVVDNTPPTFTSVHADYTAECSDDLPEETATAIDDCGEVTITVAENSIPGSCDGQYTLRRTYTATDECGNSSTAIQNITLVDTTDPVFTYVPADYVAECSDSHPLDNATATDNCSDVNIFVQETTLPGACSGEYVISRTFTASDGCGNTATATQTITIVDTTAPVITLPANYTAECSDNHPMLDATATDACGTATISVQQTTTPGSCSGEYTITRTFTAIDDCDNSSTASQTITIVDTTPPSITNFPADLNLDCDDPNPVIYPSASDLCSDATVTLAETIVAGEGESYIVYRVFTATDECGNSTDQTQTITIADSSSPTFTFVPADYTTSCSESMPTNMATATDNCGDVLVTVEESTTPTSCSNSYVLTRTFTATDNAGNAVSATQTITVTDTTAPVLTIPTDYIAECSDEHPMEAASATDDCGSVQISTVINTTPGVCDGEYIITRSFTATDACGNQSTGMQTITIVDTTAPTLTIPENYTAECSDEHPREDAFATDNCSDVIIDVVESIVPGTCDGNYVITRAFTATDDCGNSTSATQVITIIDITDPVLTIPASYTAECSDPHPMEAATATDNCSNVTITVEEETTPGACDNEYTITRSFTATDACGNSSSGTQTITIVDTTSPTFTSVPADYTAECSDSLPIENASATDNCSGVTISINDVNTPGACDGEYTISRTYTATDECGNSTSAVQTITIIDTTAPVFTYIPAGFNAECSDELNLENATAIDNCSDVTITVQEETFIAGCEGVYTLTRTFTATDACGNSTSSTQYISIIDTTAPTLSIPSDYTAECSDDVEFVNATAVDACSSVTVWHNDETIPGACTGDYTIERTFTAMDGCGNISTGIQTITIIDTTAPTLSVPGDYTAECSDTLVLGDAAATDNCSNVTLTVSESTIPGSCLGEYVVVRSFTATDECGNSTVGSQTITVVDTTAPELILPADYTAECSEAHPLLNATASDNCGTVNITVTTDTISGNCPNEYFVTRAFSASDECGNISSGVQTITIVDTIVPEFTFVPADYTAECSGEQPMDDATASDNCGNVTISVDEVTTPGSCVGESTITRTYTATDDCGNTNTAVQTISIFDTTAPVLNVPEDITSECSDTFGEAEATASDNCSAVTITVIESTDNTPSNGFIIYREFTATDECGNATSGTQTISVIDMTPPVISAPADVTIECTDEVPSDDASASDNCGDVVITMEESAVPGSCPGEFTITRTYTAVDEAGNISTETQTIYIVDTTGPFIETPTDVTLDCSDDVILENATATDGCGGSAFVTSTTTTEPGNCGDNYTIIRTFTATDQCGNTSTSTQIITIEDTTPPNLVIPEDYSIECTEDLTLDNASAFDACGSVSITVEEATTAGACDGNYTISRTFTAIDDCGNETSSTQTITVVDTTAPVFTFIPADYTAECSEELTYENATAVDACSSLGITVTEIQTEGDCPNEYIITRTFTVVDGCGNSATADQIITVQDTTVPVLTIPADYSVDCELELVYDDATATDNCGTVPSIAISQIDTVVTSEIDGTYIINRTFTAIDECGNTASLTQVITVNGSVADGDCDCDGNQEDVLGICGGGCESDDNNNGICDSEETQGCMDDTACNYNPDATINDECEFPEDGYDCNNNCLFDEDGDGVCDDDEVLGCTDPTNPNYDPFATDDYGSCFYGGCILFFACNYDPEADYYEPGSCDFLSCQGCTDETACNYDPESGLDDGSCEYIEVDYLDCDGNCTNDTDGDGICDEDEVLGCTDPDTPTYDAAATEDDGSCMIGGCVLPFACNYDPMADYYLPGSCDFTTCVGCMDETACNFDPEATLSSVSLCEYPIYDYLDCFGACINDADGDGVCDEFEVLGCTDPAAANFDPSATDDDGNCNYDFVGGCNLPFACNYDPSADYYVPGSCDFTCLWGIPQEGPCMNEMACNFGAQTGCVFLDENGNICAIGGCTLENACNYSIDAQFNDGSCEFGECNGCIYDTAINYQPNAHYDDGSCLFAGCTDSSFDSYNPIANLQGVGSCDNNNVNADFNSNGRVEAGDLLYILSMYSQEAPFSCELNTIKMIVYEGGCSYQGAINYSGNTYQDTGNCVFTGCTNPSAINFNELANVDDSSCKFTPCPDFNTSGLIDSEDLLTFLTEWGKVY